MGASIFIIKSMIDKPSFLKVIAFKAVCQTGALPLGYALHVSITHNISN